MGGRSRSGSEKKTSSNGLFFSIMNIFRTSRRSRRRVEDVDGVIFRRSDEDRGGCWVGEPDIDSKASDYIARFHESRFTEPEHIVA
ncbi:hypothetical protein QJS10_CPB17g00848 [Acorus calamus]|uniref:Uncharacterized protein n=1 Tax=Acorus calamus TaxID=4465 RepID=A0AAV9CSV7_ACOCL|nr:hypothetical protein QJS10_CPB17g00848 [Acorus calamus]